jgi:hypothetical protein
MRLVFFLLLISITPAHAFEAERFAPELRLHSKEKFRPADPDAVFRAAVPSSLAPGFAIRIVPFTPKPPWLWQKSGSRIVDLLPQTSRWELIDYWYFVPYNDANLWFGLGDHEGDWEGVALLFENEKLTAAYYSQHKGGKWYCERDLERTQDGRIVVYSGVFVSRQPRQLSSPWRAPPRSLFLGKGFHRCGRKYRDDGACARARTLLKL